MRRAGSGRNDGLKALPRELGAAGVAVPSPVRDQADPGRAGLGFPRAWVRSWRHGLPRYAQAQGAALSIRQAMDLGAETAPTAAEGRIRLFFGRARRAYVSAPDRSVHPRSGQIQIGLHVDHQVRPDAPIAPIVIATINRVPLPVLGRQPTPRGTRLRHHQHGAATKRRERVSFPTYITAYLWLEIKVPQNLKKHCCDTPSTICYAKCTIGTEIRARSVVFFPLGNNSLSSKNSNWACC